jgi:hypothetical protein
MSEMLANRYFLSGRYADAAGEFEELLEAHPPRVAVRRRLVICYTMTGRLRDALDLAVDIMREVPTLPRKRIRKSKGSRASKPATSSGSGPRN